MYVVCSTFYVHRHKEIMLSKYVYKKKYCSCQILCTVAVFYFIIIRHGVVKIHTTEELGWNAIFDVTMFVRRDELK